MDATSSSIWTFLAAPRFVFSVFPFLQQARKSSGERAASSPHVTLTLCTQTAAHFSEVLNYMATAAYIFPRIATIGSWLPSTGVSHPQTGRAHWMMKQTTSVRYSEQLQCQSPNLEILKIATKIQTKENSFEGEFARNFLKSQLAPTWAFKE